MRRLSEQTESFLLTKQQPTPLVAKREQYIKSSRAINDVVQILSENETYYLHDKAELQSSSEEERIIQHQHGLPFRSPSLTNNRIHSRRHRKPRLLDWLKKTCIPDMSTQDDLPWSVRLLVLPDGYPKLSWDMLCMVLIFYEILTIPLKISFDLDIPDALERFVDSCFYADILLNFNTAIYFKGNLCYDRWKITIEYLKLWFWLDVASSFPYMEVVDYALLSQETQSNNSSAQQSSKLAQSASILRLLRFVRFVKIIRLLRLAKLKVIFDKIEEFLQLSTTIAAIMSFLQLSVFVLFWSHWLGCIFHFVAQNEDPDLNWLTYYGIYETEWYIRYINSIYWAVTTMTTVGYGDISPRTSLERTFGIFFLLVACGVFSFTMNTIGAALQQLEGKKQEYSKQMSNTNNYMKRVSIPTQLQNRVRRYLSYIWDSSHPVNLQHITENLSQSLKYEFTIQVNGSMLAKCQVLCEMFPDPVLIDLTQCFKDATIFPDEFIFQEQDEKYTDRSLYFIQEGMVKIIQQRSKQTVARLEKGDYFGELSFFSDLPRSASAQSMYFTDIFYLPRADFLQVLKKYQLSLETFASVRDSILFKKDQTPLQTCCYSCLKDDHVLRDCPGLHFVVDPYMFNKVRTRLLQIIKHRCMSVFMKQFLRKDTKLFNALNDFEIINRRGRHMALQIEQRDMQFQPCDDADVDADDEHPQIYQMQEPATYISKFKMDRRKRRTYIRTQREIDSFKSIEHLQQTNRQILLDLTLAMQGDKQAYGKLIGLTKQVSIKSRNNIRATIVHLSNTQIKIEEDPSSEEEQERRGRKLKSYINDHKMQRNFIEVKINQDNPDVDKGQMFVSIGDFDRGANFTHYSPHNNLSVVLKELDQCVLQEIHPRIQTEYSEAVFEEMVNQYSLDLKDLKDLTFGQTKRARGYTGMMYMQSPRQLKKGLQKKSPIIPEIPQKYSIDSIVCFSKQSELSHYEPEQEEQIVLNQQHSVQQ